MSNDSYWFEDRVADIIESSRGVQDAKDGLPKQSDDYWYLLGFNSVGAE